MVSGRTPSSSAVPRHQASAVRVSFTVRLITGVGPSPASVSASADSKTFSTTDEKIRQTVKRRKGVDDEGDEAAAPAALPCEHSHRTPAHAGMTAADAPLMARHSVHAAGGAPAQPDPASGRAVCG